MQNAKTVVISCAGMGTRLGLGKPKALIHIDGKSIIHRQLELLKDVEDVRIVVGYQFEAVIEEVLKVRRDAAFVMNHDYAKTGAATSIYKGSRYTGGGGIVLALFGDILITREDMQTILGEEDEFVGCCEAATEQPILVRTEMRNGTEYAVGFSKERGKYEWTGICQLRPEKLTDRHELMYHVLDDAAPLKVLQLRTMDIDTMRDYEKAKKWIMEN